MPWRYRRNRCSCMSQSQSKVNFNVGCDNFRAYQTLSLICTIIVQRCLGYSEENVREQWIRKEDRFITYSDFSTLRKLQFNGSISNASDRNLKKIKQNRIQDKWKMNWLTSFGRITRAIRANDYGHWTFGNFSNRWRNQVEASWHGGRWQAVQQALLPTEPEPQEDREMAAQAIKMLKVTEVT